MEDRKEPKPTDIVGNDLFSTNNVLIYKIKSQIHVLLPAYFKIKYHNFLEIDLANLTSAVDLTLTFNVYYGDFFKSDKIFEEKSLFLHKKDDPSKEKVDRRMTEKEYVIGKLMRKIRFNFASDEAIQLSEDQNDNESIHLMDITHFEEESMIQYSVRKTFNVQLQGELAWSPFEIIHSILEITIQPLTIQIDKNKYVFKVNMMEPIYDSQFQLDVNTAIGEYGLASSLVSSIYSNFRLEQGSDEFKMSFIQRGLYLMGKKQKQLTELTKFETKNGVQQPKDPDILWFQYAIFNIPMYKHPMTSVVTVFVPLWLLGLINFGIFFQDESLSDRFGSIIALMIAFITYIPTIQQSIPPSSRIGFMEISVYCLSLAVLCTFIHSIRVAFSGVEQFKLQWTTTPEYIISVSILIISFGMVVVLIIIHYFRWQKNYSQRKKSLVQRSRNQVMILLEEQQQKSLRSSDQDDEKWVRTDRQERQEVKTQLKNQQARFGDEVTKFLGPYRSPNPILASNSSTRFNRKNWFNPLCDIYFNHFFECKREMSKSSQKQFNDYFLMDFKNKDHQIPKQKWPKHPLKTIQEMKATKFPKASLLSDKIQILKLNLAEKS